MYNGHQENSQNNRKSKKRYRKKKRKSEVQILPTPQVTNSKSWKALNDELGIAGGTWNVQSFQGKQDGVLPKVEPIIVSYVDLGTFLLDTTGPTLRVHKLPEAKLVSSQRAHNDTIVALEAVPPSVNHLQVITFAKCLTMAVWDVANVRILARFHIGSFIELKDVSQVVPLGFSLSVSKKKGVHSLIGWLCLQQRKDAHREALAENAVVRSFGLNFQDMVKFSSLDPLPNVQKVSSHIGRIAKHAACKVRRASAMTSAASGGLVALTDTRRILLWNPKSKPTESTVLNHTKSFTSISVCNGDGYIAAGDEVGQLLIYCVNGVVDEGLSVSDPSTFHWHSAPVACLEWGPIDSDGLTSDVMHLYSGGSECTLVMWELPQGRRSFLPRFPAPLMSLRGATSNQEERGLEALLAVGCAEVSRN